MAIGWPSIARAVIRVSGVSGVFVAGLCIATVSAMTAVVEDVE